jgi:hypothetical protein
MEEMNQAQFFQFLHDAIAFGEKDIRDFKELPYFFEYDAKKEAVKITNPRKLEDARGSFVKDFITMHNTKRDKSAWIICGVKEDKVNKRFSAIGVQPHAVLDDPEYWMQFDNRVEDYFEKKPMKPRYKMIYTPEVFGLRFLVFEFPVYHDDPRPAVPTTEAQKNWPGGLQVGKLYWRPVAKNDKAEELDENRIVRWFQAGCPTTVETGSQKRLPDKPRYGSRLLILLGMTALGATAILFHRSNSKERSESEAMDKNENGFHVVSVTWPDYRRYLDEGSRVPKYCTNRGPLGATGAVFGISYLCATSYCHWLGGHLPSSREVRAHLWQIPHGPSTFEWVSDSSDEPGKVLAVSCEGVSNNAISRHYEEPHANVTFRVSVGGPRAQNVARSIQPSR